MLLRRHCSRRPGAALLALLCCKLPGPACALDNGVGRTPALG